MAKVSSPGWMWEGREAYWRGLKLEDCPYDEGTEPHYMWAEGFKREEALDTDNEYD